MAFLPTSWRAAALPGLLMLAAASCACSHPPMTLPDDAHLVRLEVIDRDQGAVLPTYRHHGHAWVAGEAGQAYTLRLRNLGPERVLVVLSVDGVNVITGETASPDQAGYVLPPYGEAEVDGWRKSMQEVAAFRFSPAATSYAARTGRPFDVGVIGAAVFREAPVMPLTDDAALAPRRGPAAESAAAPAAPSLGTAHGERRWSPVGSTTFERADTRPDELVALRYDRYERLVAKGVIAQGTPGVATHTPRPFPGGFVPDP